MSTWCGAITLVSGPAVEPVTTDEVRAHLRIHSGDNTETSLISGWITAARELVERIIARALITQTWAKALEEWPDGDDEDGCCICLPWGRLQSITSITYTDLAGDQQTWSSTKYQVDARSDIGRVRPTYTETWPPARHQFNSIVVTFVVGYGGAAASVPHALRDAITFIVADWYEQRERPGEISEGVRNLLLAYTVGEHG